MMTQSFSVDKSNMKEALPIVAGIMAQEVSENAFEAANHTVHSAYVAKDGLNTADRSVKNARMLAFTLSRVADHTERMNRSTHSLSQFIKALSDLSVHTHRATPSSGQRENSREKENLRSTTVYGTTLAELARHINEQTLKIADQLGSVVRELDGCIRELDIAREESNTSCKLALQMKNNYIELLEAAEQTSINIDLILASTETVYIERNNLMLPLNAL